MYSIALEFETEEEMQSIAHQLWNKHEITGEFEMFQTSAGPFRLHIFSEKKIRESVIEKLSAKKVKIKGSFGSAAPKEVPSGES